MGIGSNKNTRAWQWAKYGAIFGLLVAVIDLTGWRGMYLEPFMHESHFYRNMGIASGSVFGWAILFGIAAVITNLFVEDE